MKFIALSLFFLASLSGLLAQVPDTLRHQGRIAVDGVNFDGTGEFKFLLYKSTVAGTATTPIWKNDSSAPANADEPTTAVSTTVTKGLYSLNLGESPQQGITPNLIPIGNANLYLRIWFNDGTNGFQQLSPDRQITSVPFARYSATVPDGSITAEKLSVPVTAGYEDFPLVLAGHSFARDLSSNFAGGFINFPTSFFAAPAVVTTIDETLNQNGATWVRQEGEARGNEIPFRADNFTDRIHWFGIETGSHIISGKRVQAGTVTSNSTVTTVSFPVSFSIAPSVYLMPISPNGSGATMIRLNTGTSTGSFQVRGDSSSYSFHWIAMENGTYNHGRYKWVSDTVNIFGNLTPTIDFPTDFNTTDNNPIMLLSIEDTNGSGAFWTRIEALAPQSATVRLSVASSELLNYLLVLDDN